MNHAQTTDSQHLASGEVLFHAGKARHPWQLLSGHLMLNDAFGQFVQLAHPGDYVGLDCIEMDGGQFQAISITACEVHPCRQTGQDSEPEGLLKALLIQQRRCVETVRLRTGPATERVKHLLMQLGRQDHSDDLSQCILPSLKVMSAIIDVAPETVSRIVCGLRRSAVLQMSSQSSTAFNPDQLRHCDLPSEQIWKPGTRRGGKPFSPILLGI